VERKTTAAYDLSAIAVGAPDIASRPNVKQAEATLSGSLARRSRGQTPAPNTNQSDTAAVLRSIPTSPAVRSTWTDSTISAAEALVPGALKMSTTSEPATPKAQPSTPAAPASFAEAAMGGSDAGVVISPCFPLDYLEVIDGRPPCH
jgi:hypothetical protein